MLPESICKNKKIRVRKRGREGMAGDPTPKNMVKPMPAVKSRCWRQNLKVLAFGENVRKLLIVVPSRCMRRRNSVAAFVAAGEERSADEHKKIPTSSAQRH
jgi:hypothetical protein